MEEPVAYPVTSLAGGNADDPWLDIGDDPYGRDCEAGNPVSGQPHNPTLLNPGGLLLGIAEVRSFDPPRDA